MSDAPVKLVTNVVRDKEGMDRFFAKLVDEHAKGQIAKMCGVYINPDGHIFTIVSGTMYTSDLALAIAYLQEELIDTIASRRKPAPQPGGAA